MGLIRKAAALKWNKDADDAPRLIASGRGSQAGKILALAEEAGIPIQENVLLSEALDALVPGAVIPRELYDLTAQVYIFLMELEDRAAQESRSMEEPSIT